MATTTSSAELGTARIAIDRGGTFTDAICSRKGHDDIVIKVGEAHETRLTRSCFLSIRRTTRMPRLRREWSGDSGATLVADDSIRRILSELEGKEIPKDQKLSLDRVESVRMGTTVSTNALLERNGERCALITSKGWGDVCLIGMQARPDIFDLSIQKLSFLYDEVVEVCTSTQPGADPRSTSVSPHCRVSPAHLCPCPRAIPTL